MVARSFSTRVGRATFRMVLSRLTIRTATQSTVSEAQRARSDVRHPSNRPRHGEVAPMTGDVGSAMVEYLFNLRYDHIIYDSPKQFLIR